LFIIVKVMVKQQVSYFCLMMYSLTVTGVIFRTEIEVKLKSFM